MVFVFGAFFGEIPGEDEGDEDEEDPDAPEVVLAGVEVDCFTGDGGDVVFGGAGA